MAGFADTLRGDGLAGDPTTRSQSPNPPSEEQRRYQWLRDQLSVERTASRPYDQFWQQINEEIYRFIVFDPNRTIYLPAESKPVKMAREIVKKRWVEQGIWSNKWNSIDDWLWKHEEPLQPGSDSETSSEEEPSPIFSFFPKERQPRRLKSEEEKRQIAKRRVIRERERQASRPYHQFVYQISKERERIQDESTSGEGTGVGLPDINTKAYENVKNTWTERGIWNKRWGILPGMSWKHEEPREEEPAEGAAPQANPVENGSHEAQRSPVIYLFGTPPPRLAESGIPPVESNSRQVSGVMNTSEQDPSTNIDPTG